MTFEIFCIGLFAISVLTGFVTEGIKKLLQERKKTYYANALAGYVAIGLSAAVGTGYMVLTETAFNAKMAVLLITLMFLSWLCSMLGYDKVIQLAKQVYEAKKKLLK